MNKTELNQHLNFLFDPNGEIQIILYGCFSDGIVKKMDIKGDDLPAMSQLFIDSIKEKIIDKDDYSVIPLSIADERAKCFYEYDLDVPKEITVLETIIGDDQLDVFDFNNDELSDLSALIIVIADNNNAISIYKKISPVEIMRRSSFMLFKAYKRFERFYDQLLRISGNFQLIRAGNEIIILDLNLIEKIFGFHEVIKKEAIIGLNVIKEKGIVSNINALEELLDNISFARKLIKIARNSPVIQNNIPNINIINFSKTHPAVKGKIKYTKDGSQFCLDTKKSKNLFLKLLNDDYLTSELTQLYYDSLAKDNINTQVEELEN